MASIELPRWHLSREEHTEPGTPAGSVRDLHAAAVRANYGPADGEPEPVAHYPRTHRRLSPEKWLEYMLAVRSRDAGPLILDQELQFAVVNQACGDTDFCAVWRVLDRVLDQIREQALDLPPTHAEAREGG